MDREAIAVMTVLLALGLVVVGTDYTNPAYGNLLIPAGKSFSLSNHDPGGFYWMAFRYRLNASHAGLLRGGWTATAGTFVVGRMGATDFEIPLLCPAGGCFQGPGQLSGTVDGVLLWNVEYTYHVNGTLITDRSCTYDQNGTPEPSAPASFLLVFLSKTPDNVTASRAIEIQEVPASPCPIAA